MKPQGQGKSGRGGDERKATCGKARKSRQRGRAGCGRAATRPEGPAPSAGACEQLCEAPGGDGIM